MAGLIHTFRQYGYWKCSHCGAEISGKYKLCLSCGGPIPLPLPGQFSVFYLKPGGATVEEPTDHAKANAGPDWVCSHCFANNAGILRACTSCGNVREDSDSVRKTKRYKRGMKVPQTWEETFVKPDTRSLGQKVKSFLGKMVRHPFFWVVTLIVAFISIPIFLIWLFTAGPIQLELTLKDRQWKRVIPIEKWKTVVEGDWSIPDKGREVSRSEKVHHYDHVFDHYETKVVQRSRSVPDGEESYTETVDNGDGTFSTETHSRTTYKTEYYTEDVTESVYRDDPVYQTWYEYDIEKWAYERQADTVNSGAISGWPVFALKEGEREGTRYTLYTFHFVSVTPEIQFQTYYDGSDSLWNALPVGQSVIAELNADSTIRRLGVRE
jgi:hypothetical protein